MTQVSSFSRIGSMLILGLVGLLIAGCDSGNKKVTKENFEKLEVNMTLEQVEKILGKGVKEEGGDGRGVANQFGIDIPSAPSTPKGDTYVWENGKKVIRLTFMNGRLQHRQATGM
jgi:hypothetical protein